MFQKFIERPVLSLVISIFIILLELLAVVDLPVSQFPDIELLWQLKNYIQPELHLQVIDGNKVVEVKKTAFNKGTAAKGFLDGADYDFVLAIGDDTMEEDMFEALPETSFTIKIGDKLSAARNHIKSQEEVFDFLSFVSSPVVE